LEEIKGVHEVRHSTIRVNDPRAATTFRWPIENELKVTTLRVAAVGAVAALHNILRLCKLAK
jgi:hypothetical protein